MIQLTHSSLQVEPAEVPRLRAEFQETGFARLPGFLSPPLLEVIQKQLAKAKFESTNEVASKNGRVFGTTLKFLQNEPGVVAMNFVLNRPALFDLARQIADIPQIGHFLCRVHRTTADAEQHIDWHSDAKDFRVLGLDINLSADSHTGGLFQMRDAEQRFRGEIANWVAGDAFLFKIENGWQHRLTRVESGTRTVGVGWFRTEPDWKVLYRQYID